jgi:hypothetical protein
MLMEEIDYGLHFYYQVFQVPLKKG